MPSSVAAAAAATAARSATSRLPFAIWWLAPILSPSGYGSEALAVLQSLQQLGFRGPSVVKATHHGDTLSQEYIEGLPPDLQMLLGRLLFQIEAPSELASTVVVCHSEPGAWSPALYETAECPPSRGSYGSFGLVIGRTMFETNGVLPEHVRRCNRMDEVWVPTQFHLDTFAKAGVERNKLRVVGQAVDTTHFDPQKRFSQKIRLPMGEPVFPKSSNATSATTSAAFNFFSLFKFEERKNWRSLIQAFALEFGGDDAASTALYILTTAYHTSEDFVSNIAQEVRSLGMDESSMPQIYVITDHIPYHLLPALYKEMDAFALPSRGEGWGRPHMEAMAMGLPVIATNWSGPTAFLNEDNGYPVRVESLVTVKHSSLVKQDKSSLFYGHKWAEPSLEHLRERLRQVHSAGKNNPKGIVARADIEDHFSVLAYADTLWEAFHDAWSKKTTRRDAKSAKPEL